MEGPPERGAGRMAVVMGGASVVTTLGAITPFLLGAQSVWVREELGFDESRFGIAVSVFFAVAAVGALSGGALVDRMGRRLGYLLGGLLVAAGGFGVAVLAHSWVVLLLLMGVLGLANAACQVSSNLAVAQVIPSHRRGLGFGIKQSAVPLAIVLGGLAVPTVGQLWGWRSSFLLLGAAGVVLSVVALGMSSATIARPPASDLDRPPRAALAVCGLAMACASAAANFLGAFLASWGYQVGLTLAQAGLLMAAGSAGSIAMRILVGHRADGRHGANLPVVAAQVFTGALCLTMVSVPQLWTVVVFGFLAFAVGWSWPGLFLYAVARVGRDSPAFASGIVQAGAFTGGAIGPAAFGACVIAWGYETTWRLAAGAFLVSAVLVLLARRMFVSDLLERPPREPLTWGGDRISRDRA